VSFVDGPDQVRVQVDEPGRDDRAGQVDAAGAVGERISRGDDRLDPLAPNEDGLVAADLSRLDVHHAAGSDRSQRIIHLAPRSTSGPVILARR